MIAHRFSCRLLRLLAPLLGPALALASGHSTPAPGASDLPLIETGPPSRAMIEHFRLNEKPQRRLGDYHDHGPLRDSRQLEFYDVTYYELELEMPTGDEGMSGVVRMHFRSLTHGLTQLELHAGDNLDLDQVTVNGQAAAHSHTGDAFVVTLPQALDEGQSAVLETRYTAVYGGGGVLSANRTNVQTGQVVATLTTQAEPWDARRFWPCRDEPIDKADSLLATITTQDFNTVVSNGVLRGNTLNPDGTRSVTWFQGLPMVTYLFSVCIAPYNHRSDTWEYGELSMPMHDWSWGLSPSEQQFVSQTGLAALDVFSDLFGLYPFADQKYGHAQYTWGGAMEHQSVSSMGFYNQAVIAHELMHQWFGDKVTCESFHHIWLNEGWATYGEALFFESIGGTEALHDYMDFEEYYGPGTIFVENPESENIFDGNLSYAKGSWVLHMLRHVMGDSAFFAGARNYLGGPDADDYRTVDTDEFRGFMEEAHGGSLAWFLDQWLHGEYYPDYAYGWNTTDQGTHWRLDLSLAQRQAPERQVFSMPLDLVVGLAGGQDTTIVVYNDRVLQSFGFDLPAQPLSVVLDPDQWVLSTVTPAAQLDPDPRLQEVFIVQDGDTLDTLPDTEVFQLVIHLASLGGDLAQFATILSSSNPDLWVDGMPHLHDGLAMGEELWLALSAQAMNPVQGRVTFTLGIDWSTGSTDLEFSLPTATPSLYIVDDDPDHTWEQLFVQALPEEVVQVITPAQFTSGGLAGPSLVIWHQGNTGRTFSPAERTAIANRLITGGRLVLSGQDLLQAQDSEWARQTLGLQVLATDHQASLVQGESQAFFAGDLLMFINGGAGNQSHLDRLDPDGAYPVFHYQNSPDPGDAGVLYGTDAGGGEVISLGFGLEGISGAGISLGLDEVLQLLLAWSRGEVSIGEPVTRPTGARITDCWPNPFNPATTVRFELPRAGNAELLVYNLAGQHVDTLHRGRLEGGSHQAVWQPAGRASGIYLVHLVTDGARDTQKLLLVK
jgi:aminopeptidase N